MKKKIIHPLTMIRIAKNMSQKEMAKYFMCAPAYISDIENNKKAITLKRLEIGLGNMSIRLSGYFELQELRDSLMSRDFPHLIIYRCMLTKAIGLVEPELSKEAEEVVRLTIKDDVYGNRKK